MKHKAAVSLTSPSLSLSFIILIVITADNVSSERRVGSLQADEQVHPKSIALFIGDPGDEPVFVKGRRRNDRSDFQGISRQPASVTSALRVWKFNRLMQRKKKKEQKRAGKKGTRYFTGCLFRSDSQRYIPPSLHADVFSPLSDILSSTNRKTCQLRFSQSSRSALYKELFRGERARMRAARRIACTRVHTRACTLHIQEGHPRHVHKYTRCLYICVCTHVEKHAGTDTRSRAVARDTGMDFTL